MPPSGPLTTVPDGPVEPASLPERRCVPCHEGGEPLAEIDQHRLFLELEAFGSGWQIAEGHHLERVYDFPDFKTALAFTNAVGVLAEDADHHPEVVLRWGRVIVSMFTQKVDGLTESDFILAARIEQLPRPFP